MEEKGAQPLGPNEGCWQILRCDSGPARQHRELQELNIPLATGRSHDPTSARAGQLLKRDLGDLSLEAELGRSRPGSVLHPIRIQPAGIILLPGVALGHGRSVFPPFSVLPEHWTTLGKSHGEGTWGERENKEFMEFMNIRFW